jgi:hypothetical protein
MQIASGHGTSGPCTAFAKLFFKDVEIHIAVPVSQQLA